MITRSSKLDSSSTSSPARATTTRDGVDSEDIDAAGEWFVSTATKTPAPAPADCSPPSAARELTLDAASAARSSRTSARPLDRTQVKKLLDSRNDRDVLDGLRRVISMMYRS